MPSPHQPALAARPHRNQQLFADQYLDGTLPARPEWRALGPAAEPVRAQIQAIWAAYRPSANEAQTERDLVQPVLEALGHVFEVQPALQTPTVAQKPDYVFYRDRAARDAHRGRLLTDAVAREGAYAVGDAKHWDRPLDQTLKGAANVLSNRNPAFQIAFYVQHSGVAWGILTNGRLWRLVHRESAHKLDRYYEVSLPDVLDDPAAFLYFYGFFGRAAFEPGPVGLSALLQASAEYARAVGDTLKAQVFEALRHLAQGFLDLPANALAADPATLRTIYDNALIVLYRLLFILYAEARELLPVRGNALYREEYSLLAIKQRVARDLGTGRRLLLPGTATLWPRLRELCALIDAGSPPLGLATFDGGLFDPARHPFLERHAVGDAHLQAAVDMLARVDGQFVDYRDLTVRHLGAIYEGLLEFHLEPLPDGGGAGWTVDLRNDKGERHATGSYYTPDYIVKYIVEATLAPLLQAAVAGAPADADKVAAVLALNVLDPAMGSGHFLVEATEQIARFLVEQAIPPEAAAGETDLAAWKRRVVQACIYGVDLNPLAVELAKLSLWLSTVAHDRPLSFLDHHLQTGNALVGARLADLPLAGDRGSGIRDQGSAHAVRAASRRRDRREQAARAAGQTSMLDDPAFVQSMATAVDTMWLIESNPAATVADVKTQATLYADLQGTLTGRYGRLADLATAAALGQAVDPALWAPLVAYAATADPLARVARFDAWLAEAAGRAEQHRFFHWELAFPEVFFTRHGQPRGPAAGFDAVVGNPPYVRQEALAPFKPYFAAAFPQVYHGTADLFVYFFGQGLRLLREGGRLAFIASNSWLRNNYATALRAHLRNSATVDTILDLGDSHLFADARDVRPAIVVVQQEPPPPEYTAQAAAFTRDTDLTEFQSAVAKSVQPITMHDQEDTGWNVGDDTERRLVQKLMAAGRPLAEVLVGPIYSGIKTGLTEAFIVNQATHDRLVADDPRSAALLKPMLRGEELRPWYQEFEDRWLIVIPNGWTAHTVGRGLSESDAWAAVSECYPAVARHLGPFADAARKRQDKGQYWWELRPCDYYDAFERPKIFWPDMAKHPRFSWDTSGLYVNNLGYFAPVDDPWIVGLLNSRAIWFVIMHICLGFGERAGLSFYRLFTQQLARLPIPDPPLAERAALGALALAITAEAQARYALHRRTRHRIAQDLGVPGRPLTQRLLAWWDLSFPAFRAELQRAFRADLPLRARDEWEGWLADQQATHAARTAAIVAGETDLNARVAALFDLTPAEQALLMQATRYLYGEV